MLTRVTYLTDKESRGKTTKVVNLYRLSPLLESRVAIDTQLEMLDSRKTEEIVDRKILLIDSAAGGAKETKNSSQAIMPLRGKILNTCRKDLADLIKSPIIKDILTCLGCGIGDNFNIKNLRYNRIIIMADSDPDGGHIELLLTTLFLYHLPELIKQGKVYAAVSPIYKVIDSRKKTLYFYDEKEANKWFRTHTGYEATHIKGLNN